MTQSQDFHEDFNRAAAVKAGSDRAFGIVFAVVFALIGLWQWGKEIDLFPWALGIGGAFLALALIRPALLAPLNRLWFRFGLLLHKIVNPIVMGLIFFLAVTPTALILRLLGKDPLRRKFDLSAASYWIVREPPGPDPQTMKQQF